MRVLETKIPPPIVMVLIGSVAWAVVKLLPALSYTFPLHTLVAAALAFAGVALNVFPKLAFRSAGTTVNPLKPASTTHLVTSGVYRHTRNPMYLGHSIILLSWAFFLHNVVALLAVPAFMLYVSRFQIQPEERHLSARFPDAYPAFFNRVPRWL